MYYLLALLADVGITACFSINKVYRNRVSYALSSVTFKMAVGSGVSFLLFFTLNRFRLETNGFTLGMALCMCVTAILSETVTFTAYGKGHISLYTAFQMQGGMLLPFLYGVLCGNRLTWLHAVGIAMMTAALTLTVLPARGQAERPTKGFVILCCLIFVINGVVSILSYLYSNSADGTGAQNFIMLKALMLGSAAALLCGLGPKGSGDGKPDRRALGKLGAMIACVSIIDSASYFAQLISAARLPAIVMYPIVTGGTVVLTAGAGRLFFHERHTRRASFGFLLSFVATLMFAVGGMVT